MITTLSIYLTLSGIAYGIFKKRSMLESVSEMAYIMPSWAFSIWTAIVGIALMPGMMKSLPQNWQWIGFASIAGLFCVAATPYYRTESRLLHYMGGIICFVFATAVTALICPLMLLVWAIALPAIILYSGRYWLLFCELVCFAILTLTIS